PAALGLHEPAIRPLGGDLAQNRGVERGGGCLAFARRPELALHRQVDNVLAAHRVAGTQGQMWAASSRLMALPVATASPSGWPTFAPRSPVSRPGSAFVSWVASGTLAAPGAASARRLRKRWPLLMRMVLPVLALAPSQPPLGCSRTSFTGTRLSATFTRYIAPIWTSPFFMAGSPLAEFGLARPMWF